MDQMTRELKTGKLDATVFEKAMQPIVRLMGQFEKRVTHDEQEKHEFGDFVIRYTPVMIQNTVAETLKNCLGADGLNGLNGWLDEKAEEHEAIPKQRHSLLHSLLAQKEEIFKKFGQLREEVPTLAATEADKENAAKKLEQETLDDRIKKIHDKMVHLAQD